jgi:hypothetical protein
MTSIAAYASLVTITGHLIAVSFIAQTANAAVGKFVEIGKVFRKEMKCC